MGVNVVFYVFFMSFLSDPLLDREQRRQRIDTKDYAIKLCHQIMSSFFYMTLFFLRSFFCVQEIEKQMATSL